MALKHSQQTDELFRAVLALRSVEECYQFFEDLCTVREVLVMAQRLEVARQLDDGRSYNQTMERTGASSATISRVKTCLDYGAGGYRLILDRIGGKEEP